MTWIGEEVTLFAGFILTLEGQGSEQIEETREDTELQEDMGYCILAHMWVKVSV